MDGRNGRLHLSSNILWKQTTLSGCVSEKGSNFHPFSLFFLTDKPTTMLSQADRVWIAQNLWNLYNLDSNYFNCKHKCRGKPILDLIWPTMFFSMQTTVTRQIHQLPFMCQTRYNCLTPSPCQVIQGQGHLMLNIDVIWKCLKQGICTQNITTVPCLDQK